METIEDTKVNELQNSGTVSENTNDEPISKKSQKRLAKKMNRKLAQGISALVKAEKKEATKMISDTPTKNLFCFYFGNGDEEDQTVLLDFCSKFGTITKITLFPGLNYGFVEFETVQIAIDLINSLTNKQFIDLKFYGKDRTCFFQYSKLEYDQLEKFKDMEFPDATNSVTIPGLHVIDDFITPQQEKQLIKFFDSQKWIKLMNRRVQHYGYEFVYGANNVNKSKKIQDMPIFDDEFFACKNEGDENKVSDDLNSDSSTKMTVENADVSSSIDINSVQESIINMLKGFYIQDDEAVRVFDHNQNLLNEEVKYEGLENYFSQYGEFDQLTVNDYQPGQGNFYPLIML